MRIVDDDSTWPAQADAVVTANPDVREFQVVQEGQALRLRVALRNGSEGAEERLCERARGRLAESGVP